MLQEPDSHLAEALARSGEDLLVPDFWLNDATNVLWLQVRRKVLTPDEAREGLASARPGRAEADGRAGLARRRPRQ